MQTTYTTGNHIIIRNSGESCVVGEVRSEDQILMANRNNGHQCYGLHFDEIQLDPEHIENLGSLKLLQDNDWEGVDHSLEISIFEYGLAWNRLPNGDLIILYRVENDGDELQFCRCRVEKNSNLRKEHSSLDFQSMFQMLGTKADEWEKLPLEHQIGDLLNNWGHLNIFGTSPSAKFTISNS